MSTFGKRNGGGRRRSARDNLPLVAVLTTVTGSHTAELVDISPAGARLQGYVMPQDGEEVLLTVDRLRAFGSVVWSHKDEVGIAFDFPVADEEVEALREKVLATRGLSAHMRLALDVWSAGSPR